MKELNEMTDEEKADLAKELDDALLPVFQYIQEGLLEMACWVEKLMTALANATAAPLEWLFEN
jgi:hypothetical protein